jgi:RNA polymerase sigma-70 factor (ECF subfamily)
MSVEPELLALLPRLRRLARTLTGSAATADDLVQATCERVWAHAADWVPGTRFDAWAFRILRNQWIDWARRSKTEGYPEPVDERTDLVGEWGEKRAMDKLILDDVRKAIDALPAEQREVLLLVCVEDFSYGEAAQVLGVPIGTVMSRLARARKRLNSAVEAA